MTVPAVEAAAPDSGAPAARSSPVVPAAAAVVALLVGALLGMKVLGPRFAGASKPAPTEAAKEAKTEPPRVVKLENIIVNPAGTQGQRFLIVSIAISVTSATAETKLHDAEIPLRDAINGVLEEMTLDQLTAVGARELIRSRIGATAKKFASDTGMQVYMPQFLIQ